MGRKRVTRPFFVYRLRQAYEQELLQNGFDPGQARRLAIETEVRIGQGNCSARPPAAADPRAKACLEETHTQLNAAYAV